MITFPSVDKNWRDDELALKWDKIRRLRRVITGALEVERSEKRIGSSLEADIDVYADNSSILAMEGINLAEISITSSGRLIEGTPLA